MRVTLPLLGTFLALAVSACADDSVHDDLFAEATDPTFAAGNAASDARTGGSTVGEPDGEPSGGAGGASGGIAASGGAGSDGSFGGSGGEAAGGGEEDGGGSGSGGGGGSGSAGGSGSGGAGAGTLAAEIGICGRLDAFTAAGAQVGSLTVAGITLPVAAGATLTGQVLAIVGVRVCLDAKLDSSGRVQASSVLALDLALGAQARAKACGNVRAYVAASAVTDGRVAIGGATFDIDAGASVTAASKLVVDASVCVDAKLDGSGAIVAASVSEN